jgi:hypothetical protein
VPGARFSLCRCHPNGGDRVRVGSPPTKYYPNGVIARGSMSGGLVPHLEGAKRTAKSPLHGPHTIRMVFLHRTVDPVENKSLRPHNLTNSSN